MTTPNPDFPALLFHEWRSPRLGTANPERMNNPVWDELDSRAEERWNS